MDEEEIKILNKLYDEKHIVYSPENVFLLPAIFFFRVPDQGFLACIIHHACKPPKIEKPEEKYN